MLSSVLCPVRNIPVTGSVSARELNPTVVGELLGLAPPAAVCR